MLPSIVAMHPALFIEAVLVEELKPISVDLNRAPEITVLQEWLPSMEGDWIQASANSLNETGLKKPDTHIDKEALIISNLHS